MTTLHRKPRGASEQSPAFAASNTRYYTTVDILPSSGSSASPLASSSSPNNISTNSHSGSSKTRRHGSSKYVRRASGFFGSRGSGSGSGGSPSSTGSSASKRMSTTQLRAFFMACVLVYLSTLYFAEDIVRFGKAVNSDATRQKIFSQWRPMHSAAKQYLRSMVDTANGGTIDDDEVVANATATSEPPLVIEKESELVEEKSGSPAPSMNSKREPPGGPATAVQVQQSVPPQDTLMSTTEPTSLIEKNSRVPPIVKNEPKQHEDKHMVDEGDGFGADDREQKERKPTSTVPEKEETLRQIPDLPPAEMSGVPKHNDDKEPTADTKPRDDGIAAKEKTDPNHFPVDDDNLRNNNDDHGADDAAEIEKEVQKAATVADNDEFDPAQMEDRMEDSMVAVESQETTQPGDVRTKKVVNDLHTQQPPAAVVPSFPGGDLALMSTPVVAASSISPTAAAAVIPATLSPQHLPGTTEPEFSNLSNISPPPSDENEAAHEQREREVAVEEDEQEEHVSPAPAPPKEESEDTHQDETTGHQRHPGRDET